MKTKKHVRRIFRTPEWQAFKRQCDIENRLDAVQAERSMYINQNTLYRFITFATYQRELHLTLLAQPITA